ncbi:hypothetical protein [Longimicrobium sp.]|jgi:hypothetical protein|uniref:hypothetical protein n=1 Tax=Longimicrobium sp. TaxID=2029185 RepID=UPI002EDAD63B
MKMDGASPARWLEMLVDRFGALEAVAYSSIKLSRYVSECEMSMDLLVAEAVLEFGEDLRNAQEAAGEWTDEVLAQASGRDVTHESLHNAISQSS